MSINNKISSKTDVETKIFDNISMRSWKDSLEMGLFAFTSTQENFKIGKYTALSKVIFESFNNN